MTSDPSLFADLPRQVPLPVQIACAERELAMRKRVYPRWVSDRRLTAEKAADEIAAMQAVIDTLRSLQSNRQEPL